MSNNNYNNNCHNQNNFNSFNNLQRGNKLHNCGQFYIYNQNKGSQNNSYNNQWQGQGNIGKKQSRAAIIMTIFGIILVTLMLIARFIIFIIWRV